METALAWFGQLFETILSFIPHIKIVRCTHAGVKFRAGRYAIPMKHDNGLFYTGIHFYWPITTDIEVILVKQQTINLIPQYLSTSDGVSVGVSGIIVYEVKDVTTLLTEYPDYADTINDLSLAAIKHTVNDMTYDELIGKQKYVDKNLTDTLRSQLKNLGISVFRVTLTDCTKCRVYALWGGSSS